MSGFVSKYMELGTENEKAARAAYKLQHDVVDIAQFVQHPTIARAGASPDGLIGPEGGIEIKCPKTETHIRYILAGEVPEEYKPQMLWGMACTGRQWWDFVSFDLRLPEPLQLFVRRFRRDEDAIISMNLAVLQFLHEVDETIGTA